MKNFVLVSMVIMAVPSSAYATCTNKTIFACTATNGKLIEICDNRETIEYSFGKPGKIEKNLKVNRHNVSIKQISGGYGCGNINIPSGDTIYSVSTCADKYGNTSNDLSVTVNNKFVSRINCNEKKKVIDNIGDYPESEVPELESLQPAHDTNILSNVLKGYVTTVMHSGGYTYCLVNDNNNEKTWISMNEADVKNGDYIEYPEVDAIEDFTSKSLGMHFEKIYYVPSIKILHKKGQ